jgi:hypothetical protein
MVIRFRGSRLQEQRKIESPVWQAKPSAAGTAHIDRTVHFVSMSPAARFEFLQAAQGRFCTLVLSLSAPDRISRELFEFSEVKQFEHNIEKELWTIE